MLTNRLDLFGTITSKRIKRESKLTKEKDIEITVSGFLENYEVSNILLISFIEEYNRDVENSNFVKSVLEQIFKEVENDMYKTYARIVYNCFSLELQNRYANLFEDINSGKIKTSELKDELLKSKYKENYTEDKFKGKIKTLGKKIGSKVLYPAVLLYNVLQSENVPLEVKGAIITGLGYFICPVDLIADIVPVIGYTDDLGALTMTIKLVDSYITPEIKEKTENYLNRLFK